MKRHQMKPTGTYAYLELRVLRNRPRNRRFINGFTHILALWKWYEVACESTQEFLEELEDQYEQKIYSTDSMHGMEILFESMLVLMHRAKELAIDAIHHTNDLNADPSS